MEKQPIFKTVDPAQASIQECYKLLVAGVGPRPIALVSTVSKEGINNLSPFSFFNAFGANPPVIAFSPTLRGRDGTAKDTLKNLKEVPECVVHSVPYAIVQQMSLSSTEYPSGVDEFLKSGFTPITSDIVKPKRVLESPFHMECKVMQIISLGDKNASGNLIICEVLKLHINEKIMQDGIIQPDLIDLVGRNSGNFYTRASGQALFEIEKPLSSIGIGVDALPSHIRTSEILSANNLGQLGTASALPSDEEVKEFIQISQNNHLPEEETVGMDNSQYLFHFGMSLFKNDAPKSMALMETAAKRALEDNDLDFALKALLAIPVMKRKNK